MQCDTMRSVDATTTTKLSEKLDLPVTEATNAVVEGCYICRLNNRQDQILLCEHCNGEYHTYCLQPPLQSIPDHDWYCDNCIEFDPIRKHLKSDSIDNNGLDDGLDRQVNALPYSITKRFGEIVFAQGGTGYGWWPCQIYDPRLAIDPNVRQTAQKHLYTRYLVYFFNCTDMSNDVSVKGGSSTSATNNTNTSNMNQPNTSATGTATPFSILAPKMIKSWEVGLSEDLYFGRAAKNHGKQRYRSFCDAFQLACIEYDKSINNTWIDQQRRYVLNTYVYPKTDVNSDHFNNVSTAMPSNLISPTPEKARQEAFLLPSPSKRQPSETTEQQRSNDEELRVSDVKKQKESKKKRRSEKIDWIRLPSSSRKLCRPSSTQIHAPENYDIEIDDTPHPAFSHVDFSNHCGEWIVVSTSDNPADSNSSLIDAIVNEKNDSTSTTFEEITHTTGTITEPRKIDLSRKNKSRRQRKNYQATSLDMAPNLSLSLNASSKKNIDQTQLQQSTTKQMGRRKNLHNKKEKQKKVDK